MVEAPYERANARASALAAGNYDDVRTTRLFAGGAYGFDRLARLLRRLAPVDAGLPSGIDGGRSLLVPLTASPGVPARRPPRLL